MGERVRYDGTDKRDAFIVDAVARIFVLVPVCPEVGIGMGVPRPPIHLEGSADDPRALGVVDRSLDVTQRLKDFGREKATELAGISGYIFKSKSPSCGVAGVKVFRDGRVYATGVGLFAREMQARLPLLPVVDEGGLAQPAVRDNFFERVPAYRRWQDFIEAGGDDHGLADFHYRRRLQLMSHGRRRLRHIEAFLREAHGPEAVAEYGRLFMAALKYPATVRRQVNVLRHALSLLNSRPGAAEITALSQNVAAYAQGQLALTEVKKKLRETAGRCGVGALSDQTYLQAVPW